jgi:hypothetical protein
MHFWGLPSNHSPADAGTSHPDASNRDADSDCHPHGDSHHSRPYEYAGSAYRDGNTDAHRDANGDPSSPYPVAYTDETPL